MREFAHSLTIDAPPAVVLDAFFDQEALAVWWQVKRSLCVPRALGSYAIEWDPTGWSDEVLGRLGGALRGLSVLGIWILVYAPIWIPIAILSVWGWRRRG